MKCDIASMTAFDMEKAVWYFRLLANHAESATLLLDLPFLDSSANIRDDMVGVARSSLQETVDSYTRQITIDLTGLKNHCDLSGLINALAAQ